MRFAATIIKKVLLWPLVIIISLLGRNACIARICGFFYRRSSVVSVFVCVSVRYNDRKLQKRANRSRCRLGPKKPLLDEEPNFKKYEHLRDV